MVFSADNEMRKTLDTASPLPMACKTWEGIPAVQADPVETANFALMRFTKRSLSKSSRFTIKLITPGR